MDFVMGTPLEQNVNDRQIEADFCPFFIMKFIFWIHFIAVKWAELIEKTLMDFIQLNWGQLSKDQTARRI